MLFSKTTLSFYAEDLEEDYRSAGNWPDDLVTIDDTLYQEILKSKDGYVIGTGENGLPELVEEVQTEDSMKMTIQSILTNKLNIATQNTTQLQFLVDISEATEADISNLLLWKKYYIDLMKVTKQTGYPTNVVWPDPPTTLQS